MRRSCGAQLRIRGEEGGGGGGGVGKLQLRLWLPWGTRMCETACEHQQGGSTNIIIKAAVVAIVFRDRGKGNSSGIWDG